MSDLIEKIQGSLFRFYQDEIERLRSELDEARAEAERLGESLRASRTIARKRTDTILRLVEDAREAWETLSSRGMREADRRITDLAILESSVILSEEP